MNPVSLAPNPLLLKVILYETRFLCVRSAYSERVGSWEQSAVGRARVGAGLCPEQRALCRGAVWGPRLRTGRSPPGSGEGSPGFGHSQDRTEGRDDMHCARELQGIWGSWSRDISELDH